MLHLRFFLAVGFAMVVPGLLIAQDTDSPQQARAREALHKAMVELDAGTGKASVPVTPTAGTTSTITAPTTEFPAVPPPSRGVPEGIVFKAVPPPSTSISSGVEFPAVPPPSRGVPAGAEFPAVPPPSQSLPGAAGGFGSVPPPSRSVPTARIEIPAGAVKANASLTEQQRQLEAAKKSGKAPASAYANPVIVPLPKEFVGKEAELQELLDKYKADQITAEEYFKKRAEIRARP